MTDVAKAREAVHKAIAAMAPDRTNIGPTIEADNRVHDAIDALIAAARAEAFDAAANEAFGKTTPPSLWGDRRPLAARIRALSGKP